MLVLQRRVGDLLWSSKRKRGANRLAVGFREYPPSGLSERRRRCRFVSHSAEDNMTLYLFASVGVNCLGKERQLSMVVAHPRPLDCGLIL